MLAYTICKAQVFVQMAQAISQAHRNEVKNAMCRYQAALTLFVFRIERS